MDAKSVVDNDMAYMLANLQHELITMSGCKLLITGGGGFLGYYLLRLIVEWNRICHQKGQEPIDLIVYDNFIRGVPGWLIRLSKLDRLNLKKHNVADPLPSDLDAVSYIIHAASIASPIYYRKHPIETMDANVNGLRYLLDHCKEKSASGKRIKGLLYFSTSEIYGDPSSNSIPTPETYRGSVSCTGPRACYDESKRYGETLCVNFSQQYDLPIKIVRPFNNYGPGLRIDDGRALPDFCKNVLANENIVMLSDGSPTRTFCYVADAIIGYLKVLIKGANGEAYNIGTESPEISMRQLAEMVIKTSRKLFAYSGELVFAESSDAEYLTDNPSRRCPIIDKARAEVGYAPSIGIEAGIERSLIWYRENNNTAG